LLIKKAPPAFADEALKTSYDFINISTTPNRHYQ